MDKFLAPGEQNRFLNPNAKDDSLGKPIIPISKLGATFAETGNGQQTILQSMISTIRKGSGSLQLAMQKDPRSSMGAGVASVGTEQRQAIKEMIKVSGIEWQGLEFASGSMGNVSGLDIERGIFNERKRQEDIRFFKDAIHFNAEIGGGGMVDNWAHEFQRDIKTASFNKDGTLIDFEGFDENKDAVRSVVDKRTGRIVQIQTGKLGGNGPTISVPVWETAKENGVGPNGVPYSKDDFLDSYGNKLKPDANDPRFITERVPVWDKENGKPKTEKLDWNGFKKYAEKRNKIEGINLSPEEWYVRTQLENQYSQSKASIDYYSQQYEKHTEELKELAKAKVEYEKLEKGRSEEELMELNLLVPTERSQYLSQKYKKKSEVINEQIRDLKRHISHAQQTTSQAETQANNTWDEIQSIERLDKFAKEKTTKSYAELGIYAMEETNKFKPMNPINVGPELGWPDAYGGHPTEFIEMIKNSRKEMIEMMKNNPKYRSQYTDKEIEEKANTHISGVLDTSHLSMWYNHFPTKPNEPEEERLKRFNKWYLQQIEDLAKAKVIGGVQVVDSVTGDHRHLPVGQGVFPIAEAVKVLKDNGYKGSFASEGHEDELHDPGSTQFSLWNAVGASIGNGYHFGNTSGGNSFGNVYGGRGGAAGYRMPATYTFGAYSPSEDFKPWTNIPLE
jgi:hypothetical protein